MQVTVDGLDEIFLTAASDNQLEWVSPARKLEYETMDALCFDFPRRPNTSALAGVAPDKQARAQQANQAIRKSLFERAAVGKAKWNVTLYPTQGAAQNAKMSLPDYEAFLMKAMLLDQPDPAAAWKAFFRQAAEVCRLSEPCRDAAVCRH